MSEGIIQKIMNQSNSQTFLKRLFDNLSYDYAVMIRDYYYQDIISKTQGLIEEIKKERGLIWDANTPKSKYIQFLIGDNE